MGQLAFDFDLGDDEPDWVPLFVPFGVSFLSLVTQRVCRDCGGKATGEGGGTTGVGYYEICVGCQQLDFCEQRTSELVPGAHVSHWGQVHSPGQHDALIAARARRRAKYLKKPGLRIAARSINERTSNE